MKAPSYNKVSKCKVEQKVPEPLKSPKGEFHYFRAEVRDIKALFYGKSANDWSGCFDKKKELVKADICIINSIWISSTLGGLRIENKCSFRDVERLGRDGVVVDVWGRKARKALEMWKGLGVMAYLWMYEGAKRMGIWALWGMVKGLEKGMLLVWWMMGDWSAKLGDFGVVLLCSGHKKAPRLSVGTWGIKPNLRASSSY